MAILLANEDGTVYHRYGGRTDVSPMNMDSLLEIMEKGLATHQTYTDDRWAAKFKTGPSFQIGELVENRLKGRMNPVHGCYHCHYVREAQVYLAAKNGSWTPDQFWVWPSPKRLGLVMSQTQQYMIEEVIAESPARKSGIRKGDILLRLAGERILTKYDIQWVLENSSSLKTEIPWEIKRGEKILTGKFLLEPAWKVGDPEENGWRVRNVYTQHMQKILPTPGLIGFKLQKDDLGAVGLMEEQFALKVTRLNGGTYLAGLREGDIILGAEGEDGFPSIREFYYYCELRRLAKKDIKLSLLRGGSNMKLMVSLNYLNYSNISEAPEIVLGFIAQELPGTDGLRVGNVVSGSNAEEAGLRLGDRILLVDGKPIQTFKGMEAKLDTKVPGEILSLEVRREKDILKVAYALMDKRSTVSEIARLSSPVTARNQLIECSVSIGLKQGQYVYSVNKKSLGLPTTVEFKGQGYTLVGPLDEIPPTKKIEEGMPPSWIHDGHVQLTQTVRVTDPKTFQLILRVYAQICDDTTCHEFTDIVVSDGKTTAMMDFQGDFESARSLMN